jgi:hypothetical protein
MPDKAMIVVKNDPRATIKITGFLIKLTGFTLATLSFIACIKINLFNRVVFI